VQAALDLQLEPVVYHLNGGQVERPREALGSSFHEAPYGIYRTTDGYLALSLSPVAKISAALGEPGTLQELLDPALKLSHREQIRRALGRLLLSHPTDELITLFRQHGIWCAPVNDYNAVFDDPVVAHLDPLLEFDHPEAGKVKVLKHPVRYSSGEPQMRTPPPELGEHTESVLSELGYSAEEITELREAGVV
jgi:crotonobetainyl-CoA:carnitine CoA-transferase CaiB-like acyl-CoA transferase